MEAYKCYHCGIRFCGFDHIINHNVAAHPEEKLKLRVLTVDKVTGKKCYIRQEFDVVPSAVYKDGKRITVNEYHKVVVQPTSDDERNATSTLSNFMDRDHAKTTCNVQRKQRAVAVLMKRYNHTKLFRPIIFNKKSKC